MKISELFGKTSQANPGNADVRVHGFASAPSRCNTLDGLGGENPLASNDTIEFSLDDCSPEDEVGAVDFFNSRQPLTVDLPSTLNVNRFNAQNKG